MAAHDIVLIISVAAGKLCFGSIINWLDDIGLSQRMRNGLGPIQFSSLTERYVSILACYSYASLKVCIKQNGPILVSAPFLCFNLKVAIVYYLPITIEHE